jgi:sporulation protein YlmC with PRC-barrel domain
MEIEYGNIVVDKNGKKLGTVDYVIRDSWTGEVKKFRVKRNASESEFMCSPEEVMEATETKIKVDVSSNDLF